MSRSLFVRFYRIFIKNNRLINTLQHKEFLMLTIFSIFAIVFFTLFVLTGIL